MNSGETKKIYLVISAVVVFLLLILVAYFYVYSNYLSESGSIRVNKENILNGNSINILELQSNSALTASDNLENCKNNPESEFENSKASSQEQEYVFYASFLAFARRSSLICEKTSSAKDSNGMTCAERYLMFTTFLSGNPECDKISNKELSISCSANKEKKEVLCDQISDVLKRTICQAIASEDEKKCYTLSSDQIGNCLNSFLVTKALKKNDIGVCDQIDILVQGGSFEKGYCKIALSQDPQKEWNDLYIKEVCLKKNSQDVIQ